MRTHLLAFCFSCFYCVFAHAQLSPPGLGETKTAFWSAVGVKQKLSEKNSSTTYVGTGRISGMEESNPFNAPSILVVNEELYHTLSPKWKYSFAISYRREHEYDEAVGAKEPATIQQEFRIYGRLSHTVKFGSLKWTTTLRQEVRKFYDDDFARLANDLQLRTRFKTQLHVPLDRAAHNSFIGSAEALFAIANDAEKGWGGMKYKESRFNLYYSYSPESLPVTFDIGYMNDLIGYGHHVADVSYLAFDIIINDPFSG